MTITTQMLSAIKDITVALAAIVTAGAAVVGLTVWKRELRGRAEFGVARDLLTATYRLRNQIQRCRSPFISAAEFPSGYDPMPAKRSPEKEGQAYRHIYGNRWGAVSIAIDEFDSHVVAAEALWGVRVRTVAHALHDCTRELSASMLAVIDNEASDGRDFKQSPEFAKEMRQTVHASPADEQNPFSQKISSAVRAIEVELGPHLRQG